jgi:hypothetical protein
MYSVLSAENDHQVNEDNVTFAGEALKEILRTRFAKRPTTKGEAVLRFSSLGKQPRQLWYAANKPETAEVISPQTFMKFLYGDVIEILLLFLAKEAGHEVTHEQHEVETGGVLGHMDCVIDGVPVDVKSASPYSFQKFENGSFVFDDPFGYVSQISGYAYAIGNTERAGFLVGQKVSGSIAFAPVDNLTLEANPPGPRIEQLRLAVNSETPPDKCYEPVPEGKSGNLKLGVNCSYCAFKDECWKDANNGRGLRKFWYSRGPVWLTQVVKTPLVDEA